MANKGKMKFRVRLIKRDKDPEIIGYVYATDAWEADKAAKDRFGSTQVYGLTLVGADERRKAAK